MFSCNVLCAIRFRCMKQMMALDMKVENVSVLSAICVFSSDRDDLSPEVLSTISQIQETLTQVYTLPCNKVLQLIKFTSFNQM